MPEYSLDPLQDDCYENSTVLKNKFNIRDAEQLDIMEQSVTSMLIAKAAIEIPFENVEIFINIFLPICMIGQVQFGRWI